MRVRDGDRETPDPLVVEFTLSSAHEVVAASVEIIYRRVGRKPGDWLTGAIDDEGLVFRLEGLEASPDGVQHELRWIWSSPLVEWEGRQFVVEPLEDATTVEVAVRVSHQQPQVIAGPIRWAALHAAGGLVHLYVDRDEDDVRDRLDACPDSPVADDRRGSDAYNGDRDGDGVCDLVDVCFGIDGVDENGDTFCDCGDGRDGIPDASESSDARGRNRCADGLDNDCDGAVDLDDPDCDDFEADYGCWWPRKSTQPAASLLLLLALPRRRRR